MKQYRKLLGKIFHTLTMPQISDGLNVNKNYFNVMNYGI